MARPQPINTKPGRKGGELTVTLPPGWELRLRRALRAQLAETLPNPNERGLTAAQRQARVELRRRMLQAAMCRHITDLITADIVGREVAMATRSRYGTRRGSLREHVQAILKEASKS